MATARDIQLDEDGESLHIQNLEVHDEEVVKYLSDVPAEDRGEMVARAVEIGVTAMRLMDTSKEVEHVDRRIGELENQIQKEVEKLTEEVEEKFGDDGHVESVLADHLGEDGQMPSLLDDHLGDDGKIRTHFEEAFGDDGLFQERLEAELGEDGEKIKTALDPDTEGTPTYRLKRAFLDELRDLRDEIVSEEAEEAIRARTHLKGGDFEDTVENILGEAVYQTNNELEYTGDTTGELSGRDVGDFVLTLGDTGQRIVVEAKTEYYSKTDIQDEMEDAIRNRDAEFGIFVADQLANVPETKIGWFHEFPEADFVSVVLSEDEDHEIEPGFLRIAFNWARMRAIQQHAAIGEGFDPEKLQAEINEIEDSVGRFKTIRGQCTEIQKSKNKIEEELEEIENDIKERLGEIAVELHKASASDEPA